MPNLAIDLQEGFFSDHVVIHINDNMVFDEKDISSNQMLGLARQIQTTCQGGRVKVNISITNRNIEKEFYLSLDQDLAIGVSMADGELFIRQSNTPFAYA